jgi:glucans biosynthesis protein
MRNWVQTAALGLISLVCTFSYKTSYGTPESDNKHFTKVITKARELAAQPYTPPEEIPNFLKNISYDEFENVRFIPEKSLWRDSRSTFQMMMMSAGLFYRHPVTINVIEGAGTRKVDYAKSYFAFTDPELEKRVPADLGFSGIKLTYPIISPHVQDQFLVFAGASYFRGVGKNNAWGISARGIAINTGLPTGEEFPSFIEFWLVRPKADANNMTVYALLDGKSLSGAYQFDIYPGQSTRVQVSAVLFQRHQIDLLGIAPLTSMFYYGANTARPVGEWRPEVHDSDGLLLQDGATSEWLWRPLINPKQLEMDYFKTTDVKGFGLLQRNNRFEQYQDLGAHYEKRPSTWVTPIGNWGKGHVALIQLPTDGETNDNMVAFWTPDQKKPIGEPLKIEYNLEFGEENITKQTIGRVTNTLVGDGNRTGGGYQPGAYRFIIDFNGGVLDKKSKKSMVEANVSGGNDTTVIEQFVEYNQTTQTWRLSILAKPAAEKPLELRAFLRDATDTLSETWTYRLPNNNDIVPRGQ